MMRWVFAALLLANLGLFMWVSWYRDAGGEIAAPRPTYRPELMVPLTTPGVALRARRNERTETPLAAAKPRPRCVSIGPLPADSADRAAAWLAGERLDGTRRSEERRIESSYWIYLAPFATRQDAEHRKQELERLGIRDLLIMSDAQGAIAISLGLFSQADNARHRMQELTEKGVAAQQEVRYRTDILTWFDLRVAEPADSTIEQLRTHDWGAGTVEVHDAICPSEAPG